MFEKIYILRNKFTADEMLTNINSQTGQFELNETIISILNSRFFEQP